MEESNIASVPTSRKRNMALRLCLWAGIVGPIFFVLVFTIDGFLTPGYSAMRDVISFLTLGPTGWIQCLNFFLSGLLLVFFALGFFQWMRPRSALGWLSVTTVLIALSGGGLIMAGLFPIFAALGNLFSSFVVSSAPKTPFSAASPQLEVGGLVNRIIVIVVFAWYVILASRMLRRERGGLKAAGE